MILGAESLREKRIQKELEKTKFLHKSNNQEDRGDTHSKLCYNLESVFTYCIFPLPLDDSLAYKYLNIFFKKFDLSSKRPSSYHLISLFLWVVELLTNAVCICYP